MFIFGFLTAIYFLIALSALLMTYSEQMQTGNRGVMQTTLSFLACLFWPFTFLTVALAAQRSAT